VQEHGGRIRIESRPGGGASFFVELPITGAPQAAPPPPSRTQPRPVKTTPAAARRSASILVVEDETQLANAVVEALEDAGYTVEHAADGKEALARIEARPPGLIVCDLKMPRLDGKAFFRKLEATSPKLRRRVIFVTGDVAGPRPGQFLKKSGCRGLTRPFRIGKLGAGGK